MSAQQDTVNTPATPHAKSALFSAESLCTFLARSAQQLTQQIPSWVWHHQGKPKAFTCAFVKTLSMLTGTVIISAEFKGLPACCADAEEVLAAAGSAKGMLGIWGTL